MLDGGGFIMALDVLPRLRRVRFHPYALLLACVLRRVRDVWVGGASVLLVNRLDGASGRARERLALGDGGQGHKRWWCVCASKIMLSACS